MKSGGSSAILPRLTGCERRSARLLLPGGQLEPPLQATWLAPLSWKVVAKGDNGTAIAQLASMPAAVSTMAIFTVFQSADVSGPELTS